MNTINSTLCRTDRPIIRHVLVNITRNLPNRPSQAVERTSKFSNLTLVVAQLSHLRDKLLLQRLRIRFDLLR